MPISLHDVTVPVFNQMLTNLSAMLDKAAATAAARNVKPSVYLDDRLYPDMLPMVRQVQIACDFAKNTVARATGMEAPKHPDDEADFEALKARIARTLEYVNGVPAAAFDGAETRDVTVPAGRDLTLTLKGKDFVLHFAMPNFFFHTTTAYALLRHRGVELGKRDFIGKPPGM